MKKGLLTLMVGPSGAGKSSWLNHDHFLELTPHHWVQPRYFDIDQSHVISSDQVRYELTGDFHDHTQQQRVFGAICTLAKTRIDLGLSTVVDSTSIKRADRLRLVKVAEGSPVRYIVINRPMEEKRATGGWRNELNFDLLAKHEETFKMNLKSILKGDDQPNVEVIDLRKV